MGGDAKRLEEGEVDHLGAERDRRTLDLVRGAGIVDQGRDHAVNVAPRLTDRLAHVGGLERRQLIARSADALGEAEQKLASLGRCDLPPRPAHRTIGGTHGTVDVGGTAPRHILDRLFGRRIDGGERLFRDRPPPTRRR
jgi:hypothetical protein